MKLAVLVFSVLLLASCGSESLLDGLGPEQIVVKSRASFEVTTTTGAATSLRAVSQTQPVTVTNAASANMTLNSTAFVPPTITNAVMNFGNLTISALEDNDLKVCGTSGNQKCGTALLRVYTTGAGEGLFNAADSYGVPLTASLTTPLTIGLTAANAAVMQTFSIPPGKRVMHLSDFAVTPIYNVKADFTEAGAGSFTTTIVVEYALAP